MDIDAAISAIASDAQLSEYDEPRPVQAPPPPPQPVYDVPQLTSSFRTELLAALDALLRVASVQPSGGAASAQYDAASLNLTADPVAIQRALQHVASVPGQQWAQVVAALSPEQRQDLHRRFLQFGQTLLDDVREVGQAVSVLRIIMLRVLPSLQSLPEDAKFGTSAVLADNYRVFNTVADVMRPEANQTVSASKEKAATLATQVTALTDRMKKAGLDPAVPAKDTALKTTSIILGVLLALTLIGLFIAVYFAAKGHKKAIRADTVIQAAGGRARFGHDGALGGISASAIGAAPALQAAQPYIKFPPLPQWGGSST